MKRIFFKNDPTMLRVLPDLACEIGLNESLMLMQLEYWISISTTKKHNGKDWTYQSIYDIQKKAFKFWSISKINRILNNLIDKEYLIVNNFNEKKYDRTRWFALNWDKLAELENISIVNTNESLVQNESRSVQNGSRENQNDKMHDPHVDHVEVENEPPIPEITTEKTTKNTTDINGKKICSNKKLSIGLLRQSNLENLIKQRYEINIEKKVKDIDSEVLAEIQSLEDKNLYDSAGVDAEFRAFYIIQGVFMADALGPVLGAHLKKYNKKIKECMQTLINTNFDLEDYTKWWIKKYQSDPFVKEKNIPFSWQFFVSGYFLSKYMLDRKNLSKNKTRNIVELQGWDELEKKAT